MNERRVFLKVVGAGALAAACNPAETDSTASGSEATSATGNSAATGGAGGAGGGSNSTDAATAAGSGGSTGSTSSTSSTSSASSTGSAGGGGGGLPAKYTVLGNVADLVLGTLKQAGQGVLLGLDAAGVYAMSALCTHKFCDMNPKGQVTAGVGVRCTCHSSKFDNNGAVTQGPAVKALDHFDCALTAAGQIGVDKTQVVAVGFRAMVV